MSRILFDEAVLAGLLGDATRAPEHGARLADATSTAYVGDLAGLLQALNRLAEGLAKQSLSNRTVLLLHYLSSLVRLVLKNASLPSPLASISELHTLTYSRFVKRFLVLDPSSESLTYVRLLFALCCILSTQCTL